MELIGQVASIDQTGHTFTIQRGMNGPSFTIATDSNTNSISNVLQRPKTSPACKRVKIVKVDAKMNPDGSLLAFKVKFFQPPNQMSFAGTVTSVNTGASSFQIVLLRKSPSAVARGWESFRWALP